MDLLPIPRRTRALRVGLTHMGLDLATVGIFIRDFFWRHSSYYEATKVQTGQLVLSAVAIALLLRTGRPEGSRQYGPQSASRRRPPGSASRLSWPCWRCRRSAGHPRSDGDGDQDGMEGMAVGVR
jgi:hypothetical protein